MDLLIPYCVACGRKHQPGPCAVATADLTRYAEVPLDTPDVHADFSKLTKTEVDRLFPCAVNKNDRCNQQSPDKSHWYCSRRKGHDGPHVGYYDHMQRGGVGPGWYHGDTKSIEPTKK